MAYLPLRRAYQQLKIHIAVLGKNELEVNEGIQVESRPNSSSVPIMETLTRILI